uniref:rRNA-processing protein EBP2 n=1 Tax=Polytomella parva TaxID=51329 RepID=A0A7S0VCB2_9CHLO|mmetsp:Transcript_29455/g.54057  ORF Transcript_29455/g.54057 Transcript_29455/m.54057 type:complete len:279 (+) Transcript_29455:81-917(+)|eukprot:CAMPEP_0175067044 /NCGR_PEP_ID=MMETSP0052_2-20121109/16866_1 /TAXON_ID=51329 ORGANISM="Polytomella parva, Strain SAG 63-3" /NCGR_SAMPLE_ID=MMETSP0052_2 /ASSEMBLY_ACC=CAM_ASM_000194 /LENGTH=278 /DNA_ID=CAMNT_0016333855 /DNA_START=45 /DNA_END=881 /DNA_ORIENTATION=-
MGKKKATFAEPPSEEEIDDIEEEDIEENSQDGDDEPRAPIYNVEALHDKLEDICWTADASWDETLSITSEKPVQIPNVEDDLARELAFQQQAMEATKIAIARFSEKGIPWLRPTDYYAEMVKNDSQMAKIKEQFMFEQKKIEMSTERRKQREQKQFGKQVQLEKQKERQADKKRQIEEVSKLRKQREKSGFAGDLNMDKELENMNRGRKVDAKQLGKRFGNNAAKQVGKKRLSKDAKFGHGGRKSLKKQNDAYSAAASNGPKKPMMKRKPMMKKRGKK